MRIEESQRIKEGGWKKRPCTEVVNFKEILERRRVKEDEEEKKTKKRTKIIVKPDGSRVMVITRIAAGMKTVISVRLSEPTEFSNDARTPEEIYGEQE